MPACELEVHLSWELNTCIGMSSTFSLGRHIYLGDQIEAKVSLVNKKLGQRIM